VLEEVEMTRIITILPLLLLILAVRGWGQNDCYF